MKAAINLREKPGLWQEEMAQHYLLATRQLFLLFETRKRDLPATALLKPAEIELFLSKPLSAKKKDRSRVGGGIKKLHMGNRSFLFIQR